MSSEADAWFGGLGEATPSKGGTYIQPGVYLVEVLDILRRSSQNPSTDGHRLFIVELKVRETLTAMEAEYDANGDVRFGASNKPGTTASVVVNLSKNRNTSLGNVKAFLMALLNVEEDALDDAGWKAAAWHASDPSVPKEQRGVGQILLLTGGKTTTRAQKPFTPLRWARPEAEEAGDAA